MPTQITDHLFHLPLGGVNAYLIRTDETLILIDTGSPGDEVKIEKELAELGHPISELTHIIVTHGHPDHAGSLAALQAKTDAITIMHPKDTEMVKIGKSKRPMTPSPGLLNRILFRLFLAPAPDTIDPARVDQRVEDGERLPLAGGIQVVHLPGHSLGQIGLYWPAGRTFFTADAVINRPWLNLMIGYEDIEVGKASAAKIAGFEFEIACFGHGDPMLNKSAATFREKFT